MIFEDDLVEYCGYGYVCGCLDVVGDFDWYVYCEDGVE